MGIYRMRTEFGQHMKILLGIIAAIFVVGAFYSFSGNTPNSRRPNEGQSAESDVIATVNGENITRADFNTQFEKYLDNAKEKRTGSSLSALQCADARAQIFGQLVQSLVIVTTAEKMGVDVGSRAVDAGLDQEMIQALKNDRKNRLRDVNAKEEALDPHNDRKYEESLTRAGLTIKMMEDQLRTQIPADQVRAQIATQGLVQKIMASVKMAGAKDVANSYNAYKIRQIVLLGAGSEQMKTKAAKILKAAASGEDFAKLAKENSSIGAKSGGEAVYSWETRQMFPPKMREVIEKLKPGQVSPVIDAGPALVIVKLESVTSRLPADLDQKAQAKRAQDINQDRQSATAMEFQNTVLSKAKVDVKDPELLGYWQLIQAQRNMTNPASAMKAMNTAIASLKNAIKVRENNYFASAKLADLEAKQGHVENAIRILYPMLEGATQNSEGVDMRMLLGSLLEQESKDTKLSAAQRQDSLKKAIAQYKIASEVARHDVSAHQQLQAKFKSLNQPDLVAIEAQRVAEGQKIEAALKARQGHTSAGRMPNATAPAGAPAPVPAPSPEKRKSGG